MHERFHIINNAGEAVINGLEREHEGDTEDIFENTPVRQRYLESNSILSVQEAVTI